MQTLRENAVLKRGAAQAKGTQLDKTVKAYILSCIDNSGYSDTELSTDADKVKSLHDTFYAEYGWNVDHIGEVKALREWFMGLPSACTVAFYNSDILDLAVDWGSIPTDYTESQANKILDNWFNLVPTKQLNYSGNMLDYFFLGFFLAFCSRA